MTYNVFGGTLNLAQLNYMNNILIISAYLVHAGGMISTCLFVM